MDIQSPDIARTVYSRLEEYFSIFKNIDACSVLLTGVQLVGRRVSSPAAIDEMFIKPPLFHKPISPALKNFRMRTCTQALFFLENTPS